MPVPQPPELRLLVDLYRRRAEAAIEAPIDWPFFLALLDHHRMAGLLAGLPSWIPEQVRQAVTSRRRQLALQDLARRHDLTLIAETFGCSGITWVALKGPSLGALLFRPPLIRPSRDLDILVPEADEATARGLLRNLGFEGPERHPWDSQAVLTSRAGAVVELHVAFFDNRRKLPLAALAPFDHVATVRIGHREVPTLALPQATVFAAVHGLKHFWRRLFWLADLDAMAVCPTLEWNVVLQVARHTGVEHHLAASMLHANRMFGTALPLEIAREPALLGRAARTLRLLDGLTPPPIPTTDIDAARRLGRLRCLWWEASLASRWRDRAGVLLHAMAPTPRDRPVGRLPALLVRPVRLIAEELRSRRCR